MTSQLNPYLSFPGTAREAMTAYQQVFGGALELSTAADIGAAAPTDLEALGHARLDTPEGYTLMAWDVPEGMPHRPGGDVAVYLGGDSDVLRRYFEDLSVGGTVTMPLERQVWGDEAGTVIDRFGVTWMVNITRPPASPDAESPR